VSYSGEDPLDIQRFDALNSGASRPSATCDRVHDEGAVAARHAAPESYFSFEFALGPIVS
jgi:hypothetical protein